LQDPEPDPKQDAKPDFELEVMDADPDQVLDLNFTKNQQNKFSNLTITGMALNYNNLTFLLKRML
jgi:hypothetical protein